MKYRCPYCHEELGGEKVKACPSCGKSMRYAVRRTPVERREDKRKIRGMERDADRQAELFKAPPSFAFLHKPRFLLWVVFGLFLIGFILIKSSQNAEPKYQEQMEEKAQRQVDSLAIALARYHHHTGQWPEGTNLNALIFNDGAPGWNGPYLASRLQLPIDEIARDPWKEGFLYERGTNSLPRISSKGADQTAGTADDIFAAPQSFILTDMSWTNEWVEAEERLPVRVKVLPQK